MIFNVHIFLLNNASYQRYNETGFSDFCAKMCMYIYIGRGNLYQVIDYQVAIQTYSDQNGEYKIVFPQFFVNLSQFLLYIDLFNKYICIQKIQVAVLDIDICGPSQPRVLGVIGEQVHQSGSGWSPVVSNKYNLINFLC